MKEGTYWFSKLSEQEQKEFKENVEKTLKGMAFENFVERTFITFSQFIMQGFYWRHTKQGFDYWVEISNRVVE